MVLAGVIGFAFSGSLIDPILNLTERSKELAKGNLDKTIPVNSQDEIGQLTESFNYMAKELGTTISNIETEKSKLEVLLYNMTDGVLAYDGKGKLMHSNSICQELL